MAVCDPIADMPAHPQIRHDEPAPCLIGDIGPRFADRRPGDGNHWQLDLPLLGHENLAIGFLHNAFP